MLRTALPLALMLSLAAPAAAEEAKPGTITTSATGTVMAEPDIAYLNLAVRREGKTAREALNANNQAMRAVLNEMRAEGVADRDLQTASFNISPLYEYDVSKDRRGPPTIVGYAVSNALTVRVRDLAKLGTILDRSVTLGVNEGGSVRFAVADPEPVLREARVKAVKAALEKAKVLTEPLGISLARVLQITEAGARPPAPMRMARATMAKDAESVPLAAGESGYSVTVTVRWELLQ